MQDFNHQPVVTEVSMPIMLVVNVSQPPQASTQLQKDPVTENGHLIVW